MEQPWERIRGRDDTKKKSGEREGKGEEKEERYHVEKRGRGRERDRGDGEKTWMKNSIQGKGKEGERVYMWRQKHSHNVYKL